MNVLLLGNGFDLHHNLPTMYNDFLQTVDFMMTHLVKDGCTIGDIFSEQSLQKKSRHIEKCYAVHKASYNQIYLDIKDTGKIIDLARNNVWFSYLLTSVQEDKQWIDAEREVAFVLQMMEELFEVADGDPMIVDVQCSAACRYVVDCFPFFYTEKPTKVLGTNRYKEVIEEYYQEYPPNSGNKSVDKNKVIEKLYKELEEFAECLRLYLKCFVDNGLDLIKKEEEFKRLEAICSINQAITFNYTNAAEKLYSQFHVFHLHGRVEDKIILGINPDENDMLGSVDTTVLAFKKYYQRACMATDESYIKWIKQMKNSNEELSLLIMGHSLDVTDKDIIIELFDRSNEIIILHHTEESKRTLIKNLIKIFGYEEFYRIRNSKNLSFMSTDSDFAEFREKRETKQYQELAQRMIIDEYNRKCEQIVVV